MKWKNKDQGTQETNLGDMNIILHRWQYDPHKWFLTVRHSPFHFDRYPLMELDVDDAKKEAVDLLLKKADEIQNALQTISQRDKKKIHNFKLRLVAILNEVENLEESFHVEDGMRFEKVYKTIKDAMSDLE